MSSFGSVRDEYHSLKLRSTNDITHRRLSDKRETIRYIFMPESFNNWDGSFEDSEDIFSDDNPLPSAENFDAFTLPDNLYGILGLESHAPGKSNGIENDELANPATTFQSNGISSAAQIPNSGSQECYEGTLQLVARTDVALNYTETSNNLDGNGKSSENNVFIRQEAIVGYRNGGASLLVGPIANEYDFSGVDSSILNYPTNSIPRNYNYDQVSTSLIGIGGSHENYEGVGVQQQVSHTGNQEEKKQEFSIPELPLSAGSDLHLLSAYQRYNSIRVKRDEFNKYQLTPYPKEKRCNDLAGLLDALRIRRYREFPKATAPEPRGLSRIEERNNAILKRYFIFPSGQPRNTRKTPYSTPCAAILNPYYPKKVNAKLTSSDIVVYSEIDGGEELSRANYQHEKVYLCPYCEEYKFFCPRNSGYLHHLQQIHGITSKGEKIPKPVDQQWYSYTKYNKNGKKTIQEGVTCTKCWKVCLLPNHESAKSKINQRLKKYLRHYEKFHIGR